MPNLCFSYFPNHFLILNPPPPPPQLQTSSSSSSILILQNPLLHNTHYSKPLHINVSARTKSSSSSSSLSCGLPSELEEEEEEDDDDDDDGDDDYDDALSTSYKFRLKQFNSHKHQSLVSLLRSFHFSDTQIIKIFKNPQILKTNGHATLKPKLQFLSDYGFVGTLLPRIIVMNSSILFRSLSNCIEPRLEFLEKYVHTNDKVVVAVKRYPRLLTGNLKKILQPNVDFLLSEGVTATTIGKQMVLQPRTLMTKLDKIVKAVETVKELGLNPNTIMFLEAVRVIHSTSDLTWERKLQIFKCFGLSKEEIMCAFKRSPMCFTSSDEKIWNLMDFYLNTMNLNSTVIIKNPQFLKYSLSSRIRPRYNVIKVLESKKLLNEDGKHHWLFRIAEEKFLTRIVEKHLDQVPNLMELYRGTISGDNIDIQLH